MTDLYQGRNKMTVESRVKMDSNLCETLHLASWFGITMMRKQDLQLRNMMKF